MNQPISEEDAKVLRAIEERIFSSIDAGVDLSELSILDDVNAGKKQIQELGVKIAVEHTEISVAILQIAHSVYFEHSPHGDVPDFFDAVMRMGGDRVKILILSLALFSLGKGPDARRRAAKSVSIGILGRMIAEQMNLKDECVRRVETGGLLSQIGRNMCMKARELGELVSDDFIEHYQSALAMNMIDRFKLDPFLKKAVDLSVVEFDEASLALVGVIKMAEALTEDSFRRYGKLVIKSPMPDKNNVLIRTPGEVIQKLFSILGVDDYLVIEEEPTQRQREAEKKLNKKKRS